MSELKDENPVLVQRRSGGWLALAPVESCLRIGVTAATAEQAAVNYDRARVDWHRTLATAQERV